MNILITLGDHSQEWHWQFVSRNDSPVGSADNRHFGDNIPMMALANRSDRPLPYWAEGKWTHLSDQECPLCKKVTYQLWVSPIHEVGSAEERELLQYIFRIMVELCPNHHDFFTTPDMT